jgi:nucleotide-binding universal stress UspA family protein
MEAIDTKFYFQRNFHPSDFSDASNVAFAHALKLAVSTNAKLTILHTGGNDGSYDWADFPRVRRTLERWELLPPDSPREAVFNLGLDIEKVASPHADPVRGILQFLEKHPHDLIVLATHQHDGLDRWTHKQIAEPIARRSGEMTLFIPQDAEGFVNPECGAVSLRNILIPVDYSPDPQIAVDGAAAIAQALDCHSPVFTLLHVGDDESFPEAIMTERETWQWKKIYGLGDVQQQILQAADHCRADLIVMATQGRDGFLDALRGSTTERIVRNSKCPVLAVPNYGGDVASFIESVAWRPAVE